MKIKFCVLLCWSILSSMSWAGSLSQAEYDQQIQRHKETIQHTKAVLDEPELQADVKQQNLAFCERFNAYQQIYQISDAHLHLERAALMKTVAKIYLDRQTQSLVSSGMTQQVFCSSHQDQIKQVSSAQPISD